MEPPNGDRGRYEILRGERAVIATKRADGTYVLGDSHGDLVDDRVEPSRAWCHGDDRKPESVMRAMYRRRERKREEARR